jgi:hypothetical protein
MQRKAGLGIVRIETAAARAEMREALGNFPAPVGLANFAGAGARKGCAGRYGLTDIVVFEDFDVRNIAERAFA